MKYRTMRCETFILKRFNNSYSGTVLTMISIMWSTFLFHKLFVPLASLCLCSKIVPATNEKLPFSFFYAQNTAFL